MQLYGSAMHDYVVRELEVGRRVAATEEAEACGFGPLFDLLVQEDPAMWEFSRCGACSSDVRVLCEAQQRCQRPNGVRDG